MSFLDISAKRDCKSVCVCVCVGVCVCVHALNKNVSQAIIGTFFRPFSRVEVSLRFMLKFEPFKM